MRGGSARDEEEDEEEERAAAGWPLDEAPPDIDDRLDDGAEDAGDAALSAAAEGRLDALP